MLKDKLENIISGYKINEDDADWLRAILRKLYLERMARHQAESDAGWAADAHREEMMKTWKADGQW